MKFARKMPQKTTCVTAAPAVVPSSRGRRAFTLLEVMVVVIIIGILAMLAYSSLTELIFTNRAKETAQTIRTFTERALMDAKRRNEVVTIRLDGNSIKVTPAENPNTELAKEALGAGYQPDNSASIDGKSAFPNNSVNSQLRIGLSGVSEEGCFAACGARGYCGGAVKSLTENSFRAYIKRGTNAFWEAL